MKKTQTHEYVEYKPGPEKRPVGNRCYSCKHLKELSTSKYCKDCAVKSHWEEA